MVGIYPTIYSDSFYPRRNETLANQTENPPSTEQELTPTQQNQQTTVNTDQGFTPSVRLFMTFTAQTLGFGLLFLLGFGIDFPFNDHIIQTGFHFIRTIAWWYLALSSLAFAAPLTVAFIRRKLTDFEVDTVLMLLVIIDMILTLLLV